MNVLSLSGVAAVSFALLCSSASVVTVIDLGPILKRQHLLAEHVGHEDGGQGQELFGQ